MPHKKALAILGDPWASQAPCLTFIERPTKPPKKRKDFPDEWTYNGYVQPYRPPVRQAPQIAFHRWKKDAGMTEVNTASGEFQSMPQRTRSLFESLVCRKVVSTRWPYAPSLIHVDQRQRNALRWSGDVVNTAAQGQQSTTPHEVREFLFGVF